MEPIRIDIWSDIACPWCYIGKRRLESALNDYDGDVQIEFHSFELAPDTPVDFSGSEIDFLVGHKNMPAEQVTQMLDHVTGIAASEDLEYNFDALQHTNTRKAHEVLHFAKAASLQTELKERLLRAYFTEGRHLGRIDELVELGVEVGLDGEALRKDLESGRWADAVTADVARAHEMGITGVPFFVFDGRLGVAGAQPVEVFNDVINRIVSER